MFFTQIQGDIYGNISKIQVDSEAFTVLVLRITFAKALLRILNYKSKVPDEMILE
jgi:hypothetical protein